MLSGVGKTTFVGGPAGPANVLSIRNVTTGLPGSLAAALISGIAPNQVLDLTIPQGPVGPTGPVPWAPLVTWAPGLICVASAPATAVVYGNEAYVCMASHIAGTFATDFAAGRWLKIAAKGVDGLNGTNGVPPWQTPPVPWAATTAYAATAPAACVTYQGGCYVCTTAHTSGATFDVTKWTQIAAPGTASSATPLGQCQLVYASSSQLLLKPRNGNQIWVNGALRTIPAGGWTLSNTGLTAGSLYYVYAPPTGTALEASATGHVTASDGTEVKSGDATRALVGMVYMDAGTPGTFADTPTKRYVASWFNRADRQLGTAASVAGSTASSTPTELTNFRVGFVTWADEAPLLAAYGTSVNGNSGPTSPVQMTLDAAAIGSPSTYSSSGAGYNGPFGLINPTAMAEGFHLASLVANTNGGTVTFTGQLSGIVRQ